MGAWLGAVADPPFLKVDSPTQRITRGVTRPIRIIDDHMGLCPVVRHGQEADSRLPSGAEGLGDGRERVATVEHLGAHEMGRNISIPQTKPGGLKVVASELVFDGEGLILSTPAAGLTDAATEGVHHGVEVRADT